MKELKELKERSFGLEGLLIVKVTGLRESVDFNVAQIEITWMEAVINGKARRPSFGNNYKNNEKVLARIIKLSKNNQAPVDTMGCQTQADPNAQIQVQKYQILFSLMFSTQTKGQITSICVNRLKEQGLTPQPIAEISPDKLIEMIYEVTLTRGRPKTSLRSVVLLSRMEYPGQKKTQWLILTWE